LPLLLSPLPHLSSSFPLRFSPPVSFPNLHVTTVGHSLHNIIMVLTPISCVLLRMRWMAGVGALGWPRNE
jgi:hypothetical protein